jgi:nucleoid-associated protein YgaU
VSRSISPYESQGAFVPEADASLQVHIFNVSETLSGLARRYYGDFSQWRLIADRNKIADPRQIEPGTRLLIPELPLKSGSLDSV